MNTKTEKLLFGLCTDQPIKTGLKGDFDTYVGFKKYGIGETVGRFAEEQEASALLFEDCD